MSELLSVVDENDKFIRAEDRKIVHSSTMWHRGIHVFVYNPKKEMLVQKRSSDKDKYPNTYDCSISGQVNAGETYRTSATRELKEELRIRNVDIKPVIRFRMPYGPKDYHICKLFECSYDGKIKSNKEISEIKFLNAEELKRIMRDQPKMFTPWFVEMLKWHFNMKNKLHIFEIY
jgi:isopentenyl-diphosphate delta-isomerase type 1